MLFSAPHPATSPVNEGATIGPYVVRRHLGDGGMGSVWLADDTRLHRAVALKTLRAARGADTAGRERLMKEARAAAALNHPHIATVYDVLDIDGEITIVFEYVEGRTLAAALAEGAMAPARVIAIGRQLAKAVAVAHAHGVVHRDLKPGNVMIGADDQIKVLDFGIARLLAVGQTVTQSGDTASGLGFMGTPAYAAPEQMVSSAVDERADLYALGVMLFEMASGRRPFPGQEVVALAAAKLAGPAPALSAIGVDVPAPLDALVAALLQRNPADRPASASAVLAVLRTLSGEPSTSSLPRARRPYVGWMAAAALLVAIVIGLLIGPGATTTSATQPVVAVLPLRNTSADAAKDFVAAGLSESLISSLASSPSMIVLSRTAVADALKSTTDTTRAVKDLGASFVIDGSVQQSGNQLRVSINVVRADQSIAWGQTFDGTIDRVFDLQTRMALAVGEALSAGQPSAVAKPPTSSPQALDAYWRGRALLDRWDVKGNVDAAISALSESVSDDPAFALGHAGLGLAYWQKYSDTRDQQFARLAIESGSQAAALAPDLPEVRYALAVSLAGTGRRDEAVSELKQALALRPTFDEARRKLGEVLAGQGKIDEAVSEFDKAIALRPRYWGGHSDLGLALMNAARYEDAARAFEQVIALQPDNNMGFQQLGTVYQTLGNAPKAIEAYQKALAIRPSVGAYNNMGALYHAQGNYPAAVAAYEEALKLRPNAAGGYRNLGDAYIKMGQRDQARAAYQRAVERAEADLSVNPTNGRSLAALAVYLAKAGRAQEANQRITAALAVAPDDVTVRFRAAVVSSLNGDADRALDQIGEALKRGYSLPAVRDEEDFTALRSTRRFMDLTHPQEKR
jgi:serine/threonine protein kinase/tetratricopeptide (TPR) repeat protein